MSTLTISSREVNLDTVGYTGLQACGPEGSGRQHMLSAKPAGMKQELNLAAGMVCYK